MSGGLNDAPCFGLAVHSDTSDRAEAIYANPLRRDGLLSEDKPSVQKLDKPNSFVNNFGRRTKYSLPAEKRWNHRVVPMDQPWTSAEPEAWRAVVRALFAGVETPLRVNAGENAHPHNNGCRTPVNHE